ncbi:hypothetical protein OD757_07185 [Acinetobacter sp. AYS6]|uniref:hypothetical protein n=1 Tax=Acinetobacter sp. AYS6 TaxID=2983297 RepID=UPI0021D66518|nr:hypothetical protein [Acinetobacter sp. AYS6]MCU7697003.1 hypothetical protein [Acinetobacter sp. AYS6]
METVWGPCIYWTFPIILIITFGRFEYSDNITRRIANAKLLEIEGELVEKRSSKGGGGLYIYGKTVSLRDNGKQVHLKVVSAPSSLYELASRKNKETIVLFGKILDQTFYPTKITNLNREEYVFPSSKEFHDKFIELQENAPKEARSWGYISILWSFLIIFSIVFKKKANKE